MRKPSALLQALGQASRRFGRDTRGTAVFELVLMLPLFLFGMLALVTFWDAYRVLTTSQKASYTISDLISREMEPVNDTYVNGLFSTMNYLMGAGRPTNTRVTSIFYSQYDNSYRVLWSRSNNTRAMPRYTTSTLREVVGSLPTLADGDSVVLVESRTDFVPILGRAPLVGTVLTDQIFTNFIVTRPRFVPKICMTGIECD